MVKEKETVLSNASDGRNMSVCYILPQCLPAVTIFSLLAVNIGQFTLPLELFPCSEFHDVGAYCKCLAIFI